MRQSVLVFLCMLLIAGAHWSAAETIPATVISVSSGNLLSVQDDEGGIRQVRLYGIDAPDSGQKMGDRAQQMLSAMVGDKDVVVKTDTIASKEIPLAFISLNGLSINAAMVKSGFAWVDQETCKSSSCVTWIEYQKYARNNQKGLWVDPEAEPPWKWRERRNKAEARASNLNNKQEYAAYYGSLALSGGQTSSGSGKTAMARSYVQRGSQNSGTSSRTSGAAGRSPATRG